MTQNPIDGPSSPVDASLSVAPDADAAAIARRFVRDNRDHLDPSVIADAELLISEIVTNAVRHGAGQVRLRLRLDPPGIGIAVADTGAQMPRPRAAAPPSDQTSGRGLLIVDAVSSSWGVEPHDRPPGKTVWFDLRPPT